VRDVHKKDREREGESRGGEGGINGGEQEKGVVAKRFFRLAERKKDPLK